VVGFNPSLPAKYFWKIQTSEVLMVAFRQSHGGGTKLFPAKLRGWWVGKQGQKELLPLPLERGG
jgi:hypothetical protein